MPQFLKIAAIVTCVSLIHCMESACAQLMGPPVYARQRAATGRGVYRPPVRPPFGQPANGGGFYGGFYSYQPAIAGSWYARPYPYHFDYYRMRYSTPPAHIVSPYETEVEQIVPADTP